MKTKHIRYIQLQKTKSRTIDIGWSSAGDSVEMALHIA
jgi:hypothetical protein